jgi:general stress protein 26
VGQVEQHRQINLSYEKPEDNLFVSVAGTGQLVRDSNKIHEMWKPYYKAWFPKGADDPDLALLKINVEEAEYWDAPSGKMAVLYSIAKGLASGGKNPGGDNQKIDFK